MPPPLRWYGWGERDVHIPPGLLQLLREECGIDDEVVSRPPRLDAVQVPPARLLSTLRRRLVRICGAVNVRDDTEERIRHACGRSYVDLLTLRSGTLAAAPDCVVHPGTSSEVTAVLRACSDAGCAVVPFGGGTSVVGGVSTPQRTPCIALDVDRLNALVQYDATSRLATLQAGMRGPQVESALRPEGATLGHFPQSFEFATVGGFAATRSSGQASAGYGRFDEMVRGVTLEAPSGTMRIDAQPPSATGPSLLQVVLGSEGALGVITDVTVRVRALASVGRYEGWSLPSFADGVDAMRQLAQSPHALPDVARLSDPPETAAGFAMSSSAATQLAQRYLRMRGQRTPCLVVLGFDGDRDEVHQRHSHVTAVLRRYGAVMLGGAPGSAWRRDRFSAPYLRDALLDRGVLVETLETAATWSRLHDVRIAVRDALQRSLRGSGSWPLIGCHVSHVYPEGASLYVTVLAKQSGDPVVQWLEAKRAATDALIASGGVLSHHHGVGRDHAPWFSAVSGDTAVTMLRAVKASVDPAGILNPGVLLPA